MISDVEHFFMRLLAICISSLEKRLFRCSAHLWIGLFVFFFQAEDGIRDRDVTGVQTCALPISL